MVDFLNADHWSKLEGWDSSRWPNFSPEELACKGTGRLLISCRALDMLQAMRTKMGAPFIIHSAYRSPEHNRAVGGAKKSKHMEGLAFDVSMANHDPAAFMWLAEQLGFQGIGTYPRSNFIHIDARSSRARWGDPFPHRSSRFAEETPRMEEAAPKAADNGRAQGLGATVVGAVVTDQVANGGAATARLASLPVPFLIVAGVVVVAVLTSPMWRGKLRRVLRGLEQQ
jgi:hypothetical protein